MNARLAVLLLCLALGVVLLVASGLRILGLERSELLDEGGPARSLHARAGGPGNTRISVRLNEVELRAGERAVFEVCSEGELDPDVFRDALSFLVWLPAQGKKEIEAPLDDAHLERVRHSEEGACLTLGSGRVEQGGLYAVDAVFPSGPPSEAVRTLPLRARVLARVPLARPEGLMVLALALSGMLAVFAAFEPPSPRSQPRSVRWGIVLTAVATATVLGWAVIQVPLVGALGGFSRGLALAVLEVGVALAFALQLGSARRLLALHAPARSPWLSLGAAVGLAFVLGPAARLLMRIVPSTGTAPIETFISWPSGAMAFATLGMVVPLAEELLFRGFLFGALEPRGRAFAFVVTLTAFSAAHAPQAWGTWGALLAVTLTGAVLTGLRALTGSTLAPAVCHLLYNFSLWMGSFGG